MATTPDDHPDSPPPPEPGPVEQVDIEFSGRHPSHPVDSPMADAGAPAGTAGTGGDVKVQDDLDR